ncbi:hypothetical protein [Chlorogloea sp. CCALA 695]|uniref:hypothetical protein n=1 Tax=Chlorogloea sp. CCALA 695 TaxID=2107693 RepID=UPI000D0630E6|nr:hypothetical protein [Chlorogloea sp. CCALA 695]PSB35002.1 hypothetical protein C7B70_01725 [Chlorogloea sp. CCALA 695]
MTKIYLQTHKVELWGLPSTEGEGGIYTNKSWIEKQENWGLVFLVVTGTPKQYREVGFEQKLPEITLSSKRIYFLWEKFEIEQVKQCSDGQFLATGNKRHQIFTPSLLLNNTIGFEEFRKHYMTSGLINLAKNCPPYLQTLLELSDKA